MARRGWLRHTLEHARISCEEDEKAKKRAERRFRAYEKADPLGPEEAPTPESAIE
jgi:hypothetical protein